MEKERSTKFLWRFKINIHEVTKLDSFDVNDVIHTNAQNILSLFSLHNFVNFMKKESSTEFLGDFDNFHELMKLQSAE